MSAYLMEDNQTITLARHAVALGLASDVFVAATELRETNNRALACRYGDAPVPLIFDAKANDAISTWPNSPGIGGLLSQFTYQCCEGDAMETTAGGKLLDALGAATA